MIYQQTKRLIKSGKPLPRPFSDLSNWVANQYGVRVLNVRYDNVEPDSRPRLNVILELESDKKLFQDAVGNYDQVKRNRFEPSFCRYSRSEGIVGTKLRGVRHLLSRGGGTSGGQLACGRVRPGASEAQLRNPDLWTIHILFDEVTFFFYTRAQAASYEAKGLKAAYTEAYTRKIEPYDEFGFIAKLVFM